MWRAALSKNLREVNFMVDSKHETSATFRSYLKKNFNDLHILNPGMPLSVKSPTPFEPAPYLPPTIQARYDFGVEKEVNVLNLSEEQIESELKQLVLAGENQKRSLESIAPHDDIINAHNPPRPGVVEII
eukprot:TRINITY_DN941_c0_g2_i1.p1 TRINITY_DN941_c0_g2~~TRINITY_DN941_c0_g2_i1.p1  ORF type:complete len:130 (-),score=38.61 TRINITY_DN941_c0_g2_i1:283-672(-)